MDHLNADQRKMAAAMVYPEAKHGGSRKAAQRGLKCDVRCSPESRRGSVPHGQANWVNSSALVQVGFSD